MTGVGMCTHFAISEAPIYGNTRNNTISGYKDGNIYLRCDRFTTVEELKGWLANNPVKFWYPLMEPIETHLPDEFIRKFRKLHTYDSTTHIWTDEWAGISARYVKNGNLVINNLQLDIAEQITDLQAQIDQLTINNNL